MAATKDYTFQGWLGKSSEAAKGKMEWGTFEPKKWTEEDVDIQITHCGVCGSDVHVLGSAWFPTPYPCCVGHEIVGRAVRVGANVKDVKVGDRVGVGAQARSCLRDDCPECSRGMTQFCSTPGQFVNTYGSVYPDGEGKSWGGYSDYNRTNGNFVFKIPDGLASEHAAPLLCGGATVWAPLKENGCGPGKSVGVVGVGGLGHMAVMFAKAMGADKVVGISRRQSKRDEVLAMGADAYIATADDSDWAARNKRTLDLVICTVSSGGMPFNEYLGLLRPGGSLINVGVPEAGALPAVNTTMLILNGIKLGGSLIGSPAQIKEMLEFVVKHNIKPIIQTRPMADANKAVVDLEEGKARYRYVLVNEKHL
ncbi:NADP-dependent alcohol dehydrogenase 6 [Magnaporthiopsis poae ATCC 64411]|uniref:alcohol dehydrogenase (NADP(+)) n=1 Tax=Magnaporthiopsis poae (strain ATCC 64411 / 73-15) TaxID=644358 RepID=A0A0C4E1G4_MAGP6|nr:NADP-dependent alcohol dehydrogenase 6 [Magnaporthiopsis poae ATCC 64411]